MPVRLIHAPSTKLLWETMTSRFLSAVGAHPGPAEHAAHLWLNNRGQRDLLLEHAFARGCRGWLGTPFSFWTEVPRRFGLHPRPIGLLTRRSLISRLSRETAEACGLQDPRRGPAVVRGHMLDRVFSDLLPEGVTPDELEVALTALEGDAFSEQRSRWVVGTYRKYVDALGAMGRTDMRSIPALLADDIEKGGLPGALGGADRLHIYGLMYDLRSRRRLARALAQQSSVDVSVYAISEPEAGVWSELGVQEEAIEGPPLPDPTVQPAPDGAIEAAWVAAQIKRVLTSESIEPHEIAVVARSGREDTHMAARALSDAGVPVSVRTRSRLSEIGALKAFLSLFEAAGDGWTFRPLRACVMSPYFDLGLKGRTLDHLARSARIRGLASWSTAIDRLIRRAEEDPSTLYGTGLFPDHLATDAAALRDLQKDLAWLDERRTERGWVSRSLEWLREGPFHLRGRLCQAVGEDWETVRFDQRGVLQLERLLREWSDLADDPTPMSAAAWHRLLRRLLEGSELALSSPMDKGVQVMEAQDAALTPFRQVFLVHANHGEFPRDSGSGGVFSDEERSRLADAGLPIVHRADQARRERLLWRSVTALDRVTVSYQTTSFRGAPLLPSLMVPEHDAESELARTRLPSWPPASPQEFGRRAAHTLGHGPSEDVDIHTSDPAGLRHSILAAHAESLRSGTSAVGALHPGLRPNPWNGGLSDPEVLAYLGSEFGPERVWSASQLEGYGSCPFVFFVDRVLRIGESGEVDEETTPMTFGGVAHDVLEHFYGALLTDLPSSFNERAEAILAQVTEEVLREREASEEWLGNPVLWQNTRSQIAAVVREYVGWELEHMAEKKYQPVEVEFAFGFDDDGPVELVLPDVTGTLRPLKVRGRVDRIDVGQSKGEVVHRVLDYKTGSIPSASGYEDGSLMQAALYIEVLNTLGFNAVSGRYRALKKPGKPADGAAVKAGSAKFTAALAHAGAIPGRVRAGLFQPVLSASIKKWASYYPGAEITRSRAVLAKGQRQFDDE